MKTTIFLFFFYFLILNSLLAQTESNFSLQQCIDYALINQVNVKNSTLDESIANARVGEIKSIGLPQVNGAVTLVDNPQLPRMFFSTSNPFAAGGGFPGAKKSGDVVVSPNIFQLRSSGDANITVTQLIFDGSYFVGLQAASAYRELAHKTTIQTKIQTAENVTKAYYMVLINQERSKIFDINIKRLDSLRRQVKILNQNGLAENIDVSRIEVQYNNLVTEKENFENLYQLSTLLLKFQMGMPMEEKITLSEKLETIQLDSNSVNAQAFDVNKRIEYSMLKTGERLQMLDLKNNRFMRLPRLAAFATGGLSRQDIKFMNLFQNEWFSYSRVGLNLTVPIFGLQSQYKARQSKYNLEKVQNNIANLEYSLSFQTTQTTLSFKNSLHAMENQKRNMELAAEVARVTKIKYEEGVGSNIEVTNAESDLKQAQINYYEALYNAIIAKIDYQKATGTLYNETK